VQGLLLAFLAVEKQGIVVRLAMGTLALGLEAMGFLSTVAFLVEETEAVLRKDRRSD
jgi:hypothetical protein